MAVAEAHLARVPNQLVSDDEDKAEEEDVNEFAAAGGGNSVGSGEIMGFSAPLGAGPNKRKKKRRKK